MIQEPKNVMCEVATQSLSSLPYFPLPQATSSKWSYEAYNSDITTFQGAMENAKWRCLKKELCEQDYLETVATTLNSFNLTCSFSSVLGICHHGNTITNCTQMKEKFSGREGISFYRKQIHYGEWKPEGLFLVPHSTEARSSAQTIYQKMWCFTVLL